jgi:hypothetical protein
MLNHFSINLSEAHATVAYIHAWQVHDHIPYVMS